MRYKRLPLMWLTAFVWSPNAANALDGYEKRRRTGKYWMTQMPCMLSLPADYDPKSKRKYPTVVHPHGYGGPEVLACSESITESSRN